MKSLVKKTCGVFTMMAFFVNSAFAQGSDILREDPGRIGGTAKGTLGENLTAIINYFLGLLGLIAVAFLIYAGVLMVTAGGNDEQITKARKIIMYAVVGIVIILLSYTIITFVSSALG